MNHAHYQELTSQFIDRELGPENERELFAHLGVCDECREFMKAALVLQGDILGTKPAHTVSLRPARKVHALRMVWSKRVPMSVAAILAVIALHCIVWAAARWSCTA